MSSQRDRRKKEKKRDDKAHDRALQEFMTYARVTNLAILEPGPKPKVVGAEQQPWTPESLAEQCGHPDSDCAAIMMTVIRAEFMAGIYSSLRRGKKLLMEYNPATQNIAVGEIADGEVQFELIKPDEPEENKGEVKEDVNDGTADSGNDDD